MPKHWSSLLLCYDCQLLEYIWPKSSFGAWIGKYCWLYCHTGRWQFPFFCHHITHFQLGVLAKKWKQTCALSNLSEFWPNLTLFCCPPYSSLCHFYSPGTGHGFSPQQAYVIWWQYWQLPGKTIITCTHPMDLHHFSILVCISLSPSWKMSSWNIYSFSEPHCLHVLCWVRKWQYIKQLYTAGSAKGLWCSPSKELQQ